MKQLKLNTEYRSSSSSSNSNSSIIIVWYKEKANQVLKEEKFSMNSIFVVCLLAS